MTTQSSLIQPDTLLARLAGFLRQATSKQLFGTLSTESSSSSSSSSSGSSKSLPSMFYEPILRDSNLETKGGSALARPFLASKHFFAQNREQILSILGKILGLSMSALATYFLLKWLLKSLDPTNEDKFAAKSRAEHILRQLGLGHIEPLTEYEMLIAANIITPQNIDVSWQDIGGLEHLIEDLRETVIYPLRDFEAYYRLRQQGGATSSSGSDEPAAVASAVSRRSRLVQPPKGVLLFGPPGNAKTMIAKALAKESGARFINLQVATLFDKWFGESQKRAEAVFTLAAKIQPVIIFIDEIDSFLRARRGDDHECTATMKTQFMTMWDGLTTSRKQNRILIIGATNRPEDVDAAILRRMPRMFYIGLPVFIYIIFFFLTSAEKLKNFFQKRFFHDT